MTSTIHVLFTQVFSYRTLFYCSTFVYLLFCKEFKHNSLITVVFDDHHPKFYNHNRPNISVLDVRVTNFSDLECCVLKFSV